MHLALNTSFHRFNKLLWRKVVFPKAGVIRRLVPNTYEYILYFRATSRGIPIDNKEMDRKFSIVLRSDIDKNWGQLFTLFNVRQVLRLKLFDRVSICFSFITSVFTNKPTRSINFFVIPTAAPQSAYYFGYIVTKLKKNSCPMFFLFYWFRFVHRRISHFRHK